MHQRIFKDFAGKTIEEIAVSRYKSENYFSISVRFSDKTDFTISLRSNIHVREVIHSDYSTGDQQILKQYRPGVREEIVEES